MQLILSKHHRSGPGTPGQDAKVDHGLDDARGAGQACLTAQEGKVTQVPATHTSSIITLKISGCWSANPRSSGCALLTTQPKTPVT